MAASWQGPQLDPGARAPARPGSRPPRPGRVVDLGRWATTMQHRLGHRAAGQVVQQPQRGLVGLVDVVDHQQQTVAGRGEAHQLGRPRRTSAGGWTPRSSSRRCRTGLARSRPVAVVEPVQQGRVPATEVAEGLEHRGVRPRSLDRRGRAAAGAPVALAGQRLGEVEYGASCRPRRPGDSSRVLPRARRRPRDAPSRIWSPTSRRPTSRTPCAGALRPDRHRRCSRAPQSLGLRRSGVVPSSRTQRLVQAFELPQRGPRTSPRSAC